MTAPADPSERPGISGGILAGADRLGLWLHLSLVLLVVASAVRYVGGHGLGDRALLVLPGAGVLLLVYALGQARPGRRRDGRAPASRGSPVPSGSSGAMWVVALVAVWLVLASVAPSFSWAAVPLVFVALRVLPFRWAVAVSVLMVVVTVAAWTRMTGVADPTVLLGPVCIAVLSVIAYRALERDAAERRRLLADLEAAQDDVVEAERRAVVVAERARLSRDIHDSVAQGLTSINLLLHAAEQEWDDRAVSARGHVGEAAATARRSLDEVRRVVRDLAPAELQGRGSAALPDAVRRVADRVASDTGLPVSVQVHGDPVPVPAAVATGLLRTVRGALANVTEHARAQSATVSLTFLEGEVALDVRDDGIGFRPSPDPVAGGHGSAGLRGHGLAGMRARARDLGGELVLETTPGEGTVVSVSVPLPGPDGGARGWAT